MMRNGTQTLVAQGACQRQGLLEMPLCVSQIISIHYGELSDMGVQVGSVQRAYQPC